MPEPSTQHLITLPEAARKYGIGSRTLRRWAATGDLPAQRVSRSGRGGRAQILIEPRALQDVMISKGRVGSLGAVSADSEDLGSILDQVEVDTAVVRELLSENAPVC